MHIHKFGNNYTSTEIVSPMDSEKHFHAVGDTFTSVDEFGPEHIHSVNGEETEGPIEIILTRDALERLEDEKRNNKPDY